MILVTGPASSGKTSYCLARIRERLIAGDIACRLLVPTSTMAEHLRNELARDSSGGNTLVFSPRAVSTFGKFVRDFSLDFPPVTTAALEIIVERELLRLPLSRYAAVRTFPGFRSALVRALEEFSGAGGTSADLEVVPEEFRAIWGPVHSQVALTGQHFRAARLRRAAEQIRAGSSLGHIWIAGFHGFTPPEIEVISALAQRSELVVTLPDSPGALSERRALQTLASSQLILDGVRNGSSRVLFTAPSMDAEAGEIARRILHEHETGRAFREMGVVVRSEHPWVPALRSAFERFGIPYRSYFAPPLRSHPTVQYLLAIVEAALSGWDHERTLAALRMHGSPLERAGDRFEYSVLEQLPDRGLEALITHAPETAKSFLDRLAPLTRWEASAAVPAKWGQRFIFLRSLFEPSPVHDKAPAPLLLLWKSQAAALDCFAACVDETAAVLDPAVPVSFAAFRDALEIALSSVSVRVVDRRRNVVHIVDALEARQWRLPVVFVCGMIEQQFPRHHSEDPVLSDAVRRALQARGVPVRTSAERQAGEEALFDQILTRATDRLFLSYPDLNAKGEPNLPSFFLERAQPFESAVAQPVRAVAARSRAPEPLPVIADVRLRTMIAQRHDKLSASKVEAFINCPWSFFAQRSLRLRDRPQKPWDRLNTLVQGTIGHAVFERVFRDGMSLEAAFNEVFAEKCDEAHVPDGYRTEAIRLELLNGVEQLVRDPRLIPGSGTSIYEKPFDFVLADGVRVNGQIDRIDIDHNGNAVIFDYKYKRSTRISNTVRENEKGERVQSGLYLMAARDHLGYTPAGMIYSGFKRESSVSGWVLPGLRPELQSTCSPQEIHSVMTTARETILIAHSQIVDGRIRPAPLNARSCEFCCYDTICRIDTEAAQKEAVVAE